MRLLQKSSFSLSWLLFMLITGGLFSLGILTYFNQKKSLSTSQLAQLTIPVTEEDLQVTIRSSGKVEPITSVNLSPKNPGLVTEILVEQGDMVEKGQLLARMENSEIAAQKQEASANLAEAISSLEEFESRLNQEINQLQSRLQQAQARLEQTQMSLPRQISQNQAQLEASQARFQLSQERVRRNEYLFQQGAVSQDEYDAAINEYKNAQAALNEAKQRLAEAEATETLTIDELTAQRDETGFLLNERQNTSEQERAKLQAIVDSRRAQLKLLEIRYEDTYLKAPFRGIITQRYANQGAFVTPTTSASTSAGATSTSILALAKGLEIVAKVPEIDLSQLYVGQPVDIYADAYPQETFSGEVKLIAPEAIVEEGVTSFEVKISLSKPQDKLRSKMNVDVIFLGTRLDNAVTIPTVAIVTQDGATGVMTVGDNNQPEFQPITLGVTLDNITQVIEGLTPGERVFIELQP